jgi:hypothetical protein
MPGTHHGQACPPALSRVSQIAGARSQCHHRVLSHSASPGASCRARGPSSLSSNRIGSGSGWTSEQAVHPSRNVAPDVVATCSRRLGAADRHGNRHWGRRGAARPHGGRRHGCLQCSQHRLPLLGCDQPASLGRCEARAGAREHLRATAVRTFICHALTRACRVQGQRSKNRLDIAVPLVEHAKLQHASRSAGHSSRHLPRSRQAAHDRQLVDLRRLASRTLHRMVGACLHDRPRTGPLQLYTRAASGAPSHERKCLRAR